MGYIDADAHIVECDHTWDYFDPAEEFLRPIITDGYWTIEDWCAEWPSPILKRWFEEIGSRPAVERAYALGKTVTTKPTVTDQSRKILFGQTAAVVVR